MSVCRFYLYSVSADVAATTYQGESEIVSGYAVVDEDAGIITQLVQGEVSMSDLFTTVANGTLRGTWTHGTANLGTAIFSSVTGNSSFTNARAAGRATVRSGVGVESTGGWQSPGSINLNTVLSSSVPRARYVRYTHKNVNI